VKVDYHPLFQTDLDQAARYYLKHGGRELAEAFIDEVEQALFRIAENPLTSSIVFKNFDVYV
jgi:plasmid stabilization system protein ParE